MDYKIKSNFDHICRVCLIESNKLVNIFQPNSNSSLNILQAISICCDVKPSIDDNLPKHLCDDCVMLANTVIFFRQKCEEADIKIKEYLMNERASRDPLGLMSLGDYGDYFQYDNTATEPLFPSNIPIECQTKQPTVKDVINPEYSCYMCQSIHKCCKDLVNHVIASHSQQINPLPNRVTCELCRKEFISEFECSKHISIQHTELFIINETISCPFCEELFNENKTLQNHIETHAELSYNKCEKCDCYFTKNMHLTNHNKLLHPEPKDDKDTTMDSDILKTGMSLMDDSYSFLNNELDLEEDDLIPSIVESNLNSSFMNQEVDSSQCITDFDANKILSEVLECAPPMGSFTSFKNKEANYDKNITKDEQPPQSPDVFTKPRKRKRKANEQSTPKRKYEYPFTCSQCPKKFTREAPLKRHEAKHRHDKTKMCTECGVLFSSTSELKKHIARKHAVTKKKLICTICSKEFTYLNNLNCHLKTHNIHTDSSKKKNVYMCYLCGKTFGSSSNLYTHMRRHTGEMTNICKICGKGYPRSTDLNLHMRHHTGEKPYKCDSCNASFFRSDHLVVHRRSHTGERPYTCTKCNKSFKYQSDISVHRKKNSCMKKITNIDNKKSTEKSKNSNVENEITESASSDIVNELTDPLNNTISYSNGVIDVQNIPCDSQTNNKSNGTLNTLNKPKSKNSLLKTNKIPKKKMNGKQKVHLTKDSPMNSTTNKIIHLNSLSELDIIVNTLKDDKINQNKNSNQKFSILNVSNGNSNEITNGYNNFIIQCNSNKMLNGENTREVVFGLQNGSDSILQSNLNVQNPNNETLISKSKKAPTNKVKEAYVVLEKIEDMNWLK